MNKKILIAIGVVLILGVGGYFALSSKKSANTSSTPATSGTEQKSQGGSLKDLITSGVSQTCSYSNAGSTGTVYVAGGKVRADFDVTADGKTTKSHMIVDSGSSYIWMDGQSAGFKTTFDTSAAPSASTSTAPSGSFDANANMNYSCVVGPVDSSKFALPSGVSFTSFTVPTAPPSGAYPAY